MSTKETELNEFVKSKVFILTQIFLYENRFMDKTAWPRPGVGKLFGEELH